MNEEVEMMDEVVVFDAEVMVVWDTDLELEVLVLDVDVDVVVGGLELLCPTLTQ